MATLRQQIATTAFTLTKFRDLMKLMQREPSQRRSRDRQEGLRLFPAHHEGQTRASGEPYLVHPLEVALVLAEMKMDPVAIAAGLLHDSVEDTSVTIEDIRKNSASRSRTSSRASPKSAKSISPSREEAQAENLRKMMLAMVDDIRVVLIKLADRLHNMRTLEHLCSPSASTKSPRKRWRFTRPSPTGWAWERFAANSKTWASAFSIPPATSRSTRQVERAAQRRREAFSPRCRSSSATS